MPLGDIKIPPGAIPPPTHAPPKETPADAGGDGDDRPKTLAERTEFPKEFPKKRTWKEAAEEFESRGGKISPETRARIERLEPSPTVRVYSITSDKGKKTEVLAVGRRQAEREAKRLGLDIKGIRLIKTEELSPWRQEQIMAAARGRGQEATFEAAIKLGAIPAGSEFVRIGDEWGYYSPEAVKARAEAAKALQDYKALQAKIKSGEVIAVGNNEYIGKLDYDSWNDEWRDYADKHGATALSKKIEAASVALKDWKKPDGTYDVCLALEVGADRDALNFLFTKDAIDKLRADMRYHRKIIAAPTPLPREARIVGMADLDKKPPGTGWVTSSDEWAEVLASGQIAVFPSRREAEVYAKRQGTRGQKIKDVLWGMTPFKAAGYPKPTWEVLESPEAQLATLGLTAGIGPAALAPKLAAKGLPKLAPRVIPKLPKVPKAISALETRAGMAFARPAVSVATKVSQVGIKIAPRLKPVLSLGPGVTRLTVSAVPKAAASLIKLTLVGVPATLGAAKVHDELTLTANMQRNWNIFSNLPQSRKDEVARKAGYEKFEGLTEGEQANVLAHYKPPPEYTTTEWSNFLMENTGKMQETASKGLGTLQRKAPAPVTWPVAFAGGSVIGIAEGFGYAANLPLIGANLAGRVPTGEAGAYALEVGEGMADFFWSVPSTFISGPIGAGRMTGLFVFTPVSFAKFCKGLGFDVPKSTIKGFGNSVAVSYGPLFVKSMIGRVNVSGLVAKIRAESGITHPKMTGRELANITLEFSRQFAGATPGQIKAMSKTLVERITLAEGKTLSPKVMKRLTKMTADALEKTVITPEAMLGMAKVVVKQMVTAGTSKARAKVGGWIVEIRKPARQQVVGNEYYTFGDKSRFPENKPIEPMKVPYGRPSEGMAMAPTAIEAFARFTGTGTKVKNPTLAVIHMPKGYEPLQLRLHRAKMAEMESWLRENAYPVPGLKDTYVSPITGKTYPVIHYVVGGAKWEGLTPKQLMAIQAIASKEALADALFGWYGRQKIMEARFLETYLEKIDMSLKALKKSKGDVAGPHHEIVSQIELPHPDGGTINPKVRGIIKSSEGILLANDRADPRGVYDLIGGSCNVADVLVPSTGKWIYELPIGKRPKVTWDLAFASQAKGELDMNVKNVSYLGMYRGIIGEHAVYGTRLFECRVDTPYFNRVKAWKEYQKYKYGYPNPEIHNAFWWNGKTEITVYPHVFDMLEAVAGKYGLDMSKVKIYAGPRVQNIVRDVKFADRISRNRNPDLSSAKIKKAQAKWLKSLKRAYEKGKYGEHSGLKDYFTATPDMELLTTLVGGRRRAIKVFRDGTITAAEAKTLLANYGSMLPPKLRELLKSGKELRGKDAEAIEAGICSLLEKFEESLKPLYNYALTNLKGEYIKSYTALVVSKVAIGAAGHPYIKGLKYYPTAARYPAGYIPKYPAYPKARPAYAGVTTTGKYMKPPTVAYGKPTPYKGPEPPPYIPPKVPPPYKPPQVPYVPPKVPGIVPKVPAVPAVPKVPYVPKVPKIPAVPKVPQVPKIPPVKIAGRVLTREQVAGIIAWKQGWCYKLIFPPYGKDNIINSRKPLPGVIYYKGAGSAAKSIVARGGEVPYILQRDMGIFDIKIVTPRKVGKKGRKPKLSFKRDIKQRTTVTPMVASVR